MEKVDAKEADRRALRGCVIAFLIAFGLLSLYVAYWVGRIHQDQISGRDLQDQQISMITRYLEQHGDRYASLSFNRGPSHKFRLEGRVRTQEDLDDLTFELIRLFGESRANFILMVEVGFPEEEKPTVIPETDAGSL